MRGPKDYYRVLHVDPAAPVEIIKASYRTLMQRLKRHPDLGGDHEGAALINEAYAVLSDPERRAAYDRARAAPGRATTRAAPAEQAPTHGIGGRCVFCSEPYDLGRSLEAEDCCARCASPLFPAERQRLDSSGQRMLSRVHRELPVTCYTSWPQRPGLSAEMHDLSLNGMQITAPFAARPGALIKVDSDACRAVARVAYCRAAGGRFVIGLEFVTLKFERTRGSFVSASV
jgi:hypothetical protein